MRTMDALRQMGFTENDSGSLSLKANCVKPGPRRLKVDAIEGVSLLFVERVTLIGTWKTERTARLVEYNMPAQIDSFEQATAFVAYAFGSEVELAGAPPWLTLGRSHADLLPWNQDLARLQAEHESRPRCFVEYDWAKVALKKLADLVGRLTDEDLVTFWFDGTVLTIDSAIDRIVVMASGKAWEVQYQIKANTLQKLPRRLQDRLCVEIAGDYLAIGHRYYSGLLMKIN